MYELLILAASIGFSWFSGFAPDDGSQLLRVHCYSTVDMLTLKWKAEAVIDESERNEDHAWAGVYSRGGLGLSDRMPWNILAFAPRKGFVCSSHIHGGVPTANDMGFGQLEEKDGSLFLKWAFPNSELATTIGNRFRPVRWGDQRYLIAEKEMLNFCNAVNSGEAPKHGVASDFFLREGDEKKQAAGLPALPDPWRGHLLERPLSAKIISVSAAPESQHNVENPHERMVTLNVGKKQGVFVGMKFHRQELDIPFHVFRVSRVGDSTSEAESFLLYNYESVVSKPPPTVGWELSTISSEGSANRQKDDGAPR
ncbi:MAG TPA: hypothetical protein DD670_08865 [Planctomycetaceae bacterium]|nr:hypothetical protein [Planctomycetaceae bacterium]